MIYPKEYFDKIDKITIEYLKEHGIKALILDMDNTLINRSSQMPENVSSWAKELKGQGIKLIIVSNSNRKEKLEKISKILGIDYIFFAKKPLKSGLMKAARLLGEDVSNIAVVGDQLFTDVIGGNRCKMYTILVDALEDKDFWYTAWKRPIENRIKEKIKKLKSENKN